MSQRHTALDVSLLTIGGTSYLPNLRSATLHKEFPDEDSRSVAMRVGRATLTKRKTTMSAVFLYLSSATRRVNLDVSVFTIGGTALIGNLSSGSIEISTDTEDGSGISDENTFPNPVGTTIVVNGELMVTGSDDLALQELAADGAITALSLTVVITIGGQTLELPMVLTSLSDVVSQGSIQKYNITLKSEGTTGSDGGIVTPMTGHAIFVSVLTGTAVMAIAYTTKSSAGSSWTGNGLIMKATRKFAQSSLVEDSFDFEFQGGIARATS